MTTAVLSTTSAIPAQRTARDIEIIAQLDDPDYIGTQDALIEGLAAAREFVTTDTNGADEVIFDPEDFGPSRFGEFAAKVERTLRHHKCSLKAKNKPYNLKKAEASAAVARGTDNGGSGKKKLPKRLIRRLYAGELLSRHILQKYDLTPGQARKQEQNMQRVVKAKQRKKIALAVA